MRELQVVPSYIREEFGNLIIPLARDVVNAYRRYRRPYRSKVEKLTDMLPEVKSIGGIRLSDDSASSQMYAEQVRKDVERFKKGALNAGQSLEQKVMQSIGQPKKVNVELDFDVIATANFFVEGTKREYFFDVNSPTIIAFTDGKKETLYMPTSLK